VNVDEMAVRLFPETLRRWVRDGTLPRMREVTKRYLTLVLGITHDGVLLQGQVIWHGKTKRSTSTTQSDFVTQSWSNNHWANCGTIKHFVESVLKVHHTKVVEQLRKESPGRPPQLARTDPDPPLLLVWDHAPTHNSAKVREFLSRYSPWLLVVYVPRGTTAFLQPLDAGVNAGFKAKLKALQLVNLTTGKHSLLQQKMAFKSDEVKADFMKSLDSTFIYYLGTGKRTVAAAWGDGEKMANLKICSTLALQAKGVLNTLFEFGVPGAAIPPRTKEPVEDDHSDLGAEAVCDSDSGSDTDYSSEDE